MSDVRVVEVPLEATHDLRRRVLRESRPDAQVTFPEDERPGAFHLGAVDADGRVVGVASVSPEATPWRPGRVAARLRGMAVDDDVRGRGIGRALLVAVIARLRERGDEVLWANARDTAIGFYEREGMDVVGAGFLTAGLPHHVVVLDLTTATQWTPGPASSTSDHERPSSSER